MPAINDRGEVLKKGEAIYLGTLKQKLEGEHTGEYIAIDVDSGSYLIDSDRLVLIQKAEKEFEGRLFYTVQIGNLNEPTINYRERKNVAWIFG